MGMFDRLQAVNLTHGAFKHNGVEFQTKSLECNGSYYIIFNNQLWCQHNATGGVGQDGAALLAFSGCIDCYTSHTEQDRTYWIQYEIEFTKGVCTNVTLESERLTEDRSDKSALKPSPLSRSTCLTIDFRGVDGKVYDAFHANLDANLAGLRGALGDPKAEIVLQMKSNSSHWGFAGRTSWIHHVVQSLEDFERVDGDAMRHTYTNGNSVTLCLDEAHTFNMQSALSRAANPQ
jgi:hypothetical protein